jgi:uncharacterized alkaline shock family protein YloU
VAGSELRIPLSGPGVSGELVVAPVVVAKLAGTEARATYGVVAMQVSPMKRLARLGKGSLTAGVTVDLVDETLHIGLHVIMERGVNLAQVTANLQDQVRYRVEKVAGIPVADITVRVEDLQD